MNLIDVASALDEVRSNLNLWADKVGQSDLEKAFDLASAALTGLLSVSATWEGLDETELAPLGARTESGPCAGAPAEDSLAEVSRSLKSAHADRYNAFTVVHDEDALRDANNIGRIPCESRGRMWGMPIAIKDNIDVRGWTVTAGSKTLDEVAENDAPAIAALRTAGAVPIAQTNMDELAWGGTTNNLRYGPTTNPAATQRGVTGSSGGSAVAVASGVVDIAIGTDTGGSVRLPAAAVGVVGFRPSTGLIDGNGVLPLATSYDTIGVMGRNLEIVQCATEVMSRQALTAPEMSRPLRLGIIQDLTPHGTDFTVAAAWADLETALYLDGIELEPIEIDGLASFFDVWFLIHLIEPARSYATLLENSSEQLGNDVLVTLLAGAILPDELLDRAQHLRAHFNATVDLALGDFDAVLAPTIAFAPPMIGDDFIDLPGGKMSMLTAMPQTTWLSSMAGLPAASIPIQGQGSLPVGCQVIAPRGRDEMVFLVARNIERLIGNLRRSE